MKILKKLTSSLVAMLLLFSATFSYAHSYAHYEISGTRELPDDEITQTTFENFECLDGYGGVFYVNSGANLTFKDGAILTNNKAENINDKREDVGSAYASAYGGGIYNYSGDITFNKATTINSNTVNSIAYGGTVITSGSSSASVNVSGCGGGGGIYNDEGNIIFNDETIIDLNTLQLELKAGTVKTYYEGGYHTRANVNAEVYGGGVYNTGFMEFNEKTKFRNNKINVDVTAGLVEGKTDEMEAYVFVMVGGAGLAQTESNGIIFNNDVLFKNNGIDVTVTGGKAIITGDSVEKVNVGTGMAVFGGAVSIIENDFASISKTEPCMIFNKKTVFEDNYVKSVVVKGGEIEYDGISEEEIEADINDEVGVANFGGAVGIVLSAPILFNDDVEFVRNKAEQGGAIGFMASNAQFNKNIKFDSNNATNRENDNIKFPIGSSIAELDAAKGAGGAIFNIDSNIDIQGKAEFTNNEANYGGAVANYAIYFFGLPSVSYITFNDGAQFLGNKADKLGGAIYNKYGVINLTANTNDVEFTGNTANGKSSAIYDEGGTINLQALNEGKIVFNDSIQSKDNTSTININVLEEEQEEPAKYGKVILNANMNEYTGTINIDNGTVMIDKEGTWFENASAVNVAKATVEMINDTIQTHNFNNVTLTNNLYLTVDVDLAKGEMDTINFTNFINNTGKEKPIEVTELNVLSDKEGTTILTFTDTVAEQVITNITTVTSKDEGEYDVSYDATTGKFTFIQTKAPIKPQPEPQPVAIVDVVSSAIDTVQSNVMGEVFIDMNNKVDSLRQARNKGGVLYASTVNQVFEGEYSISRGLWLRPFGMQEDIKVNGTKIETKSYGTLAGLDLVAGDKELINVYIGVTGANQKKNELKVDQVNYLLGASAMYVEENWYVGLTANVGTNKSTVKEENKQDEFNTMVYTVGLKGGYNIDLSSKVSIEPNVTAWYGNTTNEEYNSEVSGTKVGQNTTNKVEVKPAVKVKINLPKDWMPYATIGYAFNLSKDNEISVRPIDELGTNGYTEYGIGVNKTFNRFDVYLQGTGRCGGRDGYGANAGIKYAF